MFICIKQEPERKDKIERALTKIEKYNSNNNQPGQKKKSGLANLDPLPQLDGLSKFL